MSTSVVFNGVTYTVPTLPGEAGWATTLSSYLQALATGTAIKTIALQSIRTATTTPVSVLAASDYTVVTNLTVPGAVVVNLPAGVAKQIFVIVDGKGDAATNNVTVTANGAETINGSSTHVLNVNYSGVMIQFDGTGWKILGTFVGKLTASRALVSDANGKVSPSAVTATELGYVAGVTSAVQTQINTKAPLASPTFTGTVTAPIGLGVVHSSSGGVLSSSTIVDADVNASAAIAYSKLNLSSSILNADVNASAAIAYSKLNLSSSILNADVNASAAIAYSKLALSNSIVNADINASAAIAYSKLNLSGSILNADVNASAAIALSKLAATTASRALVSDGSGFVSASAVTSTELGFLSGATSTVATINNTQILTAKTLTSPVLNTPVHGSYDDFTETSTPATPSAGSVRVYAKTDKRMYLKDSNGIEQQIGSGSTAGINYIANQNFETGAVTGWATYADAAATTPVDGTGGSPTVTFAAQSGSNVRGTYSGRLTKTAVNSQGQGASYDFTIDPQDKGKPLNITFDCLASAAFVAADVRVYVYDVTNSTLISPASVNIAAGTFSFNAFFVATTSTSYRLILHVASTNASAWTLDTDNFNVGPAIPRVGAAVTDWQSYTPTIAGFGTSPTTLGEWRRVGDSMEVRVGVRVTNTTGATTQSFTLPSGYLADPTKIMNNSGVAGNGGGLGYAMVINVGTGAEYNGNMVLTSDNTTFNIYGGGGAVSWNSTVPVAISTNSAYHFTVTVPIANWSSNVTMADRAVESYYSTSGTWDANDTTTAYGSAGTAMGGALTAARTKTVTLQQTLQPTDRVALEIRQGSSTAAPWVDMSTAGYAATAQGALSFGAYVSAIGTNTVSVVFNQYAFPTNTAYSVATSAQAWNSSWSWRIRIVSAGAQIGGAISTANIVGRVDGSTVGSGYIGETLSTGRVGTGVTVTTGTPVALNTTALTVTPGVWKLSAIVGGVHGVGGISYHEVSINTVNNALAGTRGDSNRAIGVVISATGVGGTVYLESYINISASTAYYITAQTSGANSSSGGMQGTLVATRIA